MTPATLLPEAVAAAEDAPVIDRDNPWPGLIAFPEAAEAFFNGRDGERDDLLRLIRRETLTLLYGLSGLGKSSLLRAGLFPLLRQEHFLPVYVRLDHAETSPPHDAQLMHALRAECEARGVEAPAPRDGESAWELLHRADGGFWDAKNYPVTPVLVIDQFEEIFTLGMQTPARQDRSRRFMAELGDLIDNRPPDALVHRLDADPDAAAAYAFSHPGCKIVVSMREDFLPELGRLGEHTRSTFQNYLRLLRMRGDTAVEAILSTGGALVDRDVARAIVCFLAKVPADRQAATDLATVEVEPALLSLVCRELNQRRRQEGLDKIDLGLLDVSQTAILARFYDDSFAGMSPGMRVFVEEELLTETGYRDAAAMDDALRLSGVTAEAIDALVARRLIRKEERFGTPRVELTHDVLTDVVRESRDQRRADEDAARRRREHEAGLRARRRRIVTGLAVLALLVATAGGAFAFFTVKTQGAVKKLNQLYVELGKAQASLKAASDTVSLREAEVDEMDRRLRVQSDSLAAAAARAAVQRDSLATLMGAMQVARLAAEQSRQEAVVEGEAAAFIQQRSYGLLQRRQAADSALAANVRAAEQRTQAIVSDAESRSRAAERTVQALVGVLCQGREKSDTTRNQLLARVDSALGDAPLCAPDRASGRVSAQRQE